MAFGLSQKKILTFNPTSEEVFIDFKMCQNRAVNLSISNLFGQIVLSEKGANANRAPHRLDVSRLESGMYYIRVEAAGMRAVVRKLQLVN